MTSAGVLWALSIMAVLGYLVVLGTTGAPGPESPSFVVVKVTDEERGLRNLPCQLTAEGCWND